MSEDTTTSKYVLVFDWGNTLMKVFPEYAGPMAEWPVIEQIPGAGQALARLARHHTMVVATNASDSDAAQVWMALERAGLGKYFKAVFTDSELGSQKPMPGFFRQLESVLAQPSCQMVIVGDSYPNDVLGAKGVGWKAIWYNPGRLTAPGSLPLEDADLFDLADLPVTLENLSLPDYATCMGWLEERETPYNILAHVQVVAAAAYLVAMWLSEKDIAVDPVLAHRGGLLHDLGKIDSIRQSQERGVSQDHASLAHDILLARGQPMLAEIANRHMIYADPAYPRRPRSWEEKLVNFADKLIENNRPVTIQERITALKARYPRFAADIQGGLPILLELEQEICDHLDTHPAGLIHRLNETLGLR